MHATVPSDVSRGSSTTTNHHHHHLEMLSIRSSLLVAAKNWHLPTIKNPSIRWSLATENFTSNVFPRSCKNYSFMYFWPFCSLVLAQTNSNRQDNALFTEHGGFLIPPLTSIILPQRIKHCKLVKNLCFSALIEH